MKRKFIVIFIILQTSFVITNN